MAWVVCEGVDRSGKSTIANLYKNKGYKVVHMSAPSKKYNEPGYAGPSYLDDVLDIVMQHDGEDVFWDRSWYGEEVWPHVYGRDPQLTPEDIEIIQEFESRNDTKRLLMIDPDAQAHWQRCVDNKEPLNISQFRLASTLFNKMAHTYNFIPSQLKDFVNEAANNKQNSPTDKQEDTTVEKGQSKTPAPVLVVNSSPKVEAVSELDKLEKANAIRDVISKRILKQKGEIFDTLENELKNFLKMQLSNIFTDKQTKNTFSDEEIQVLKVFCQRLKEKEGKSNDKKA